MTDREKLMENPLIRRFVESGDDEKASQLSSMAYLLFSIANAFQEEANDLIRKHGLYHFQLKFFGEKLTKAFDQYHSQLRSLMTDIDSSKDFTADYEAFEKICRKFMKDRNFVSQNDENVA